ncbi:MAG: hypothetical protein KC561_01605 [Myxococcales bacterium]|nr:hypothetical protein [Myxococcales bacterium]
MSILISLIVLLSACGAEEESSDYVPVRTASGSSRLWQTNYWGDYGSMATLAPSLGVADAVAVGERVYIVVQNAFGTLPANYDPICRGECDAIRIQSEVNGPTATQWLLWSLDAGQSWRLTEFQEPDSAPEGFLYDWDAAFSIAVWGDRIVQVPVASDDLTIWGFYDFDPETARASLTPELGAWTTVVPPFASSQYVSAWGEWDSSTDRYFYSTHLNLITGESRSEALNEPIGVNIPGGPRLSAADARSNDAVTWFALSEDVFGAKCVAWAQPRADSYPNKGGCLDEALLPLQMVDAQGVHLFPSGVTALVSTWEGHIWALPLPPDPSGSLDPMRLVDMGPGEVTLSRGFHNEYGRTLHITDGTERHHWLDLTPDGSMIEYLFPQTPCAGRQCGDQVWFERALPMPDDQWFLLYVVDDAADSHRRHNLFSFTIAVQTAAYDPERLDLPESTSPLSRYPQATSASALEESCQVWTSCGERRRFFDCVASWQNYPGCSALDAFLAVDLTAADVCEQLNVIRPNPTCDDPANYPEAPVCDDPPGTHCEGDRIVQCANGHEQAIDCSLLGLDCELQEDQIIRCGAIEEDAGSDCNALDSYVVACHGQRYLSWCRATGERHWLDCEAVGFDGCAPSFWDTACFSDSPD